jgi:hypothetical protein
MPASKQTARRDCCIFCPIHFLSIALDFAALLELLLSDTKNNP